MLEFGKSICLHVHAWESVIILSRSMTWLSCQLLASCIVLRSLSSDKYHLGIYSLAMPAGKLYVVSDPNLILALQRMPKAVSFWPIAARLTANLAGFSDEARVRFLDNVMKQDHHESLFVDGLKLISKALQPGDALDQMTLVAAKRIATVLDGLSGQGRVRLEMGEWVRHEITLAATEGIYGPSNPFRHAEVEKSFW